MATSDGLGGRMFGDGMVPRRVEVSLRVYVGACARVRHVRDFGRRGGSLVGRGIELRALRMYRQGTAHGL